MRMEDLLRRQEFELASRKSPNILPSMLDATSGGQTITSAEGTMRMKINQQFDNELTLRTNTQQVRSRYKMGTLDPQSQGGGYAIKKEDSLYEPSNFGTHQADGKSGRDQLPSLNQALKKGSEF